MFDDDKTRGQEAGFYRFGDFASRDASAADGHDAAKVGAETPKAQVGNDHGDALKTDFQDDAEVDAQDDAQDDADGADDAGFEPDEADAPQGEIEQVREILFGAAQRATDERLRELEESVDSLRSDMMRLFADLEARVADGDAAVERRHAMATQGIGSALSEIGAQILRLSGRNSG